MSEEEELRTPAPEEAEAGVSEGQPEALAATEEGKAPERAPRKQKEEKGPSRSDEEDISRLKSSYDQRIAALQGQLEQARQEAAQITEAHIAALPPNQREAYLRDYYTRQLGTLARERDILETSLRHNIPIEDLQGATSPEHLRQIVDLKLRERKMREEEQRRRAELDKMVAERLEAEKEAIRRAILEELGMTKVATGAGNPPSGADRRKERELSAIREELKKAKEAGDSLAVIRLSRRLAAAEQEK